MHGWEDLFALGSEYRELRYMERRLYRDSPFVQWQETAFTLFAMQVLNVLAVIYFAGRILTYGFGFLRRPQCCGSNCKHSHSKPMFHVHATALNIDKRAERVQKIFLRFDCDSSSIICDKSANVHVCNDKKHFLEGIQPTDQFYVATIGGEANSAQGMGTVRWTWRDDNGDSHTFDIQNVLYFPQSPVNMLSVTTLAGQLDDEDGTGIDTKRRVSQFY